LNSATIYTAFPLGAHFLLRPAKEGIQRVSASVRRHVAFLTCL
jgi:hypothetical protein